MANYKNRRPKSFKGHCGLCCLRTTNGKRNGRRPSPQELRFSGVDEGLYDYFLEIEEANHAEASLGVRPRKPSKT